MVENAIAELERRLAIAEDESDLLDLRLARIEDVLAGDECVPADLAMRVLRGESPVRVWREYRGLSLRELARRTDLSPTLLSEIEGGKKEGSLRTLRSLAQQLGVTLDELVCRGNAESS